MSVNSAARRLSQDDEPKGRTAEDLLRLVDLQAGLLISVATGGPRIEHVNDEYQRRRSALHAGLRRLGVESPFPWRDLWGWHGTWKDVSATYAGRRKYINDLAEPVRKRLEQVAAGLAATDTGPSTLGWPELEKRLGALHAELVATSSIDDLQDVGRRAREIHIDLAGLVYRDEMLPASESEQPKASDAKNRLFYSAVYLMPGSPHEQWRSLIRSAWDLANKITHSIGINRVDAFAVVQATVLLVRCFEQAVLSVPDAVSPLPDSPGTPTSRQGGYDSFRGLG